MPRFEYEYEQEYELGTMESVIRQLEQALRSPALVQSFSGVRTVFGHGPEISEEHTALALAYGFSYARRTLAGMSKGVLIVGRDPRPTGDAIGVALARGFLAGAEGAKCKVRIYDLGIITTPLIETAAVALKAHGGVMITASHNPLTDNGFKFLTGVQSSVGAGSEDAPPGALLSASAMGAVVQEVASIAAGDAARFIKHTARADDKALRRVYGSGEDHVHRVKAERAYLDFIGKQWGIQPHCLKPLTLGPALLDPNGGAACGIGARVLEHFGVRAIEVNAELGYPEHAIDTDGIDPASGKHMLLRVARATHRANARFGIAFDYDADRGNIVLPGHDEATSIIPPQSVAAVNIALALTHWEMQKRPNGHPLAVVLSDATSGASEEIARLFKAKVFMVETGEINVVTRMHQLRQEGYAVPVGVEGANGGTIFGAFTCRDGLQTAMCAALGDEQPALARQWMAVLKRNRCDALSTGSDCLRFPEIIQAVPRYYNRMFRFEGPAITHAEMKSRIEYCFEKQVWPDIIGRYKSFKFLNFEGTQQVRKRTGDETGGWRVLLEDGSRRAFIFARGSRTEAGVWRIIVDDPDHDRGQLLADVGMRLMKAACDDH